MDRKLKERLIEETNIADGVKDEIWARLESQLDSQTPQAPQASQEQHAEEDAQIAATTMKNMGRSKFMKIIKVTTGVVAAAIAVTAFLSFPMGTALMKSMQSWFEPEKKIEITLEGEKEETNGQVHVNQESRYAIYYDKDRYKLVQEGGKDVITTIDLLPEPYPQVSLTIEQKTDKQPEKLAAEIAKQLGEKFANVREIERVASPVDGYRIHAIDGNDRLSRVTTIYVTDNKKQGSFVLSMNYFLEAAEGHGARFTQTLEQFEVLEDDE